MAVLSEKLHRDTSAGPVVSKDISWRVDSVEDVHLYQSAGSRAGKVAIGLFMGVWLTGWTFGCVMLVREVITKPSVETCLFATPFFVGWFAGAAVLLWTFFGYQRLLLSPRGLGYESGIFTFRKRRLIPLEEIEEIRTKTDSSGDSTTYTLVIDTLGEPLSLSASLREVEWLRDELKVKVRALREKAGITTRNPVAAEARDDDGGILFPALEPKAQVSDSKLVVTNFGDELVVQVLSTTTLGAIVGILMLNLFWNGIVGVFVLQLVKDFQWFPFLFLIPFELIGLLLIFGLLGTLTAPFCKESWTFRRDEILWKKQIVGMGRRTTYPVAGFERIELHRSKAIKKGMIRTNKVDTGEIYSVRLFDGTPDAKHIDIHDLTEGDALYLADILYRDRSDLFPNPPRREEGLVGVGEM